MKTLRPYQQEAADNLWRTVSEGLSKALIVMATGLGKTVLASHVTELLLNHNEGINRVLCMVDSLDITTQNADEFKESLEEHGHETHVVIGSNNFQARCNGAEVVFTTLQTMRTAYKSLPADMFDLIVVDEAHHGKAVTYEPAIRHFDPLLLVGLTATRERADGRDIRDIFGDEVYTYDLAKAIAADEWLARVDYHLLTDNLDIRQLHELIRRVGDGDRTVSRKQLDDTIFLKERMEEQVRIIREHQRQPGRACKKTIIFCRSIKHARRVAKLMPEARQYHSKVGKSGLEQRMRDFRSGKLKTLLVIDKFNEGIDIPDAELIVFLRATDSKTIWLQQLGRGLRRTAEKLNVTVLDFVANCDRILAVHELGLDVTHYGGGDDKPKTIDITSNQFKLGFTTEILDLLKVLDRLNTTPYETYEEAQAAAQALGPKNCMEYQSLYKTDPKLPCSPRMAYPSDWTNWPDYLGTENKRIKYPTYAEAQAAAQALGFKDMKEYKAGYKQDPRLPASPYKKYANEWVSGDDFLGTQKKTFYKTYEEARAAVQALGGVTNTTEYGKRYNEDPLLPSNPNSFYESWISWDDFLGRTAKLPLYESYEKARAAVQRLGVQTSKEYTNKRRIDPRLPSEPRQTYKATWVSWDDFLGRKNKSQLYATYQEARAAVRALGITTYPGYLQGRNTDPRLPGHPQQKYASDWVSWDEFLERPTSPELYSTYQEARTATRSLGYKAVGQYKGNRKTDDPRLPSNPNSYYKEDWISWLEFLGTANKKKK